MSEDDSNDDQEYELVMPFVAVKSEGGVYDDAAFVAGWECGNLDNLLRVCAGTDTTIKRYFHPELLEQIDLIAMKHGFNMVRTPDEDDSEWVLVVLTFGGPEEGNVVKDERH